MNKTGESFCEGEGELANEIGVHLEELHSEIEDMVQAIEDSIVVSWASECGMLLSSVFCCPLTTSLLLYYSEFWQWLENSSWDSWGCKQQIDIRRHSILDCDSHIHHHWSVDYVHASCHLLLSQRSKQLLHKVHNKCSPLACLRILSGTVLDTCTVVPCNFTCGSWLLHAARRDSSSIDVSVSRHGEQINELVLTCHQNEAYLILLFDCLNYFSSVSFSHLWVPDILYLGMYNSTI